MATSSASAGKFGTQAQPTTGTPLKTFNTGVQDLSGAGLGQNQGGLQSQGLWGQDTSFGQQDVQQGLQAQNLGQQNLGQQNLGSGLDAQPSSRDTSGFWGQGNQQQNLGTQQQQNLGGWRGQQQPLQQQQQFARPQMQQQQFAQQNLGTQQLSGQQQILQAQRLQQGGQTSYERAPIVQQILHPMRTEEVQPVIQRQHERTHIKQVIAPIYQREDRAPIYSTKQLPAETRPAIYNAPTQEFNQKYYTGLPQATTTQYQPHVHRVFKQPIINESVQTTVVEEIYPVVHREIYQPQIIQETLPVIERVVDPPILTREERAPYVLGGQGQKFVEMDVKHHT